jgi:ABC-type iron transport system FetAB permease component
MKALKIAGLRGLRTAIQSLAGVAAAVPIVNSVESSKVAGVVALWGGVGAVIAGVGAFLQNYAEALEKAEEEI